MSPSLDACPDDEALAAVAAGEFDEDREAAVFAHVEACPACAARLAEREQDSNPFLKGLWLNIEPDDLAKLTSLPRPDEPPDPPGYEILDVLGMGGMGIVHKARHLRLNRIVALKRMRVQTPGGLHRFRREAETVAALQHPNIIQIYEVGDVGGHPYLALEHVAGKSLLEVLRHGRRPITPREAAALLAKVADAVQHAHDRGIVHRDLKPGNILLQPTTAGADSFETLDDVAPKIGDFGIAKWLAQEAATEDDAWATRTGALLGTPCYMAPEQLEGRNVGPLVDVYALGVILYMALAQRLPFPETSRFPIAGRPDPRPPSALQRGVPRDLDVICLKCLQDDPTRRYARAADLAADLRRFLDGAPILARPTPFWEAVWKAARRRPALAGALAAVQAALVVIAAGAWWYNGRLRDALQSTRAAEAQAETSARTALDANRRLVEQVRTTLQDVPATRALRRGLLETAVDGLRRVTTSDANAPRLSRAAAHRLLGEVHWELGRTDEAVAEMERSRAVASALLAADPTLDDAREQLALACRRLGSFHLRGGRPEQARPCFQEALDVAEAWRRRSPEDPRAELAVIQGLEHQGHAAHWGGDLDAAGSLLERMLAMTEARLAAQPDDDESQKMLGSALDLLGGIAETRGDLKTARDRFQRSLDLELAAEARRGRSAAVGRAPEDDPAFRNVVVSLNNLAVLDVLLGDMTRAAAEMDAGLDRARRWAAHDPEDVQRKLDLIDALVNRAGVETDRLAHAAAIPFLEEAQTLLNDLRSAGKLDGLPIYGIERTNGVIEELEVCRLATTAVEDASVIWKAPPYVAPRVATARIGLLLQAGRRDEAIAEAERLAAFDPVDSAAWLAKARSCSQLAETFDPLAARLVEASIQALGKVYDAGGAPPKRLELETDPRLAAARRSPAFAAILARAPAQ
ncbi:protein kinase domain-containing protein [Paludisphaera rhizosphaerae]|uniref:protein kinase domain-containing protein n=1 Tax=Paludisphaera rhizosphaerae TaxID=2711216 RepID=UPI0013EBD594|nr:protein kinase [Paludisphaera rhizosphaerae]